MKKMIKVSIIIANYNKQKYLKQCINSVLRQTYNNIEIIVVDDGSSDKSIEILNEFAKKNLIKLFCLKKNMGVSFARNYGAHESSGDVIGFLDSDDIFINNKKIETEVKLYKPNRLIYSQWVPIDENGKLLQIKKALFNHYLFNRKSKILSASLPTYIQLRGYLIPKKIFLEIGGYNTNLNYYEDFDLQIRLSYKAHIRYTHQFGEAYRQTCNGLSHSKNLLPNIAISEIQKKYTKELSKIEYIRFKIFNYFQNKKIRWF